MNAPDTLTLSELAAKAHDDFSEWLRDRKSARRIPHRLEECGYVAVRNGDAKDGLWKVDSKRQAIDAKAAMSLHDRVAAARDRAGAR